MNSFMSPSFLLCFVSFLGMSMPIAHVEESWQMAEFYNNKVLPLRPKLWLKM